MGANARRSRHEEKLADGEPSAPAADAPSPSATARRRECCCGCDSFRHSYRHRHTWADRQACIRARSSCMRQAMQARALSCATHCGPVHGRLANACPMYVISRRPARPARRPRSRRCRASLWQQSAARAHVERMIAGAAGQSSPFQLASPVCSAEMPCARWKLPFSLLLRPRGRSKRSCAASEACNFAAVRHALVTPRDISHPSTISKQRRAHRSNRGPAVARAAGSASPRASQFAGG